jgi:hypothetical protein
MLAFRKSAGPVLATLLFRAGGITIPRFSSVLKVKRTKGKPMPSEIRDKGNTESFRLSLDGWAVLIALLLAAAVRLHILKAVPW